MHSQHIFKLPKSVRYVEPCIPSGEKLIEHLKKWLDTTKLLETPHSWEPGQESDIAAAILELFHLLPQQASKFLETQGVSESYHACLTFVQHTNNLTCETNAQT